MGDERGGSEEQGVEEGEEKKKVSRVLFGSDAGVKNVGVLLHLEADQTGRKMEAVVCVCV